MGSAVGLRSDFSALDLRALARRSGDAAQVRRLLALAMVYASASRREAALAGGVGLQTVGAFGFAVQRARPGWADLRKGSGKGGVAGCGATPRAGRDRRSRSDAGGARGGALAAKCLITAPIQAILPSNGRPLGECRVK